MRHSAEKNQVKSRKNVISKNVIFLDILSYMVDILSKLHFIYLNINLNQMKHILNLRCSLLDKINIY